MKYERIGSWDVSLKIPAQVRNILRQQFEDYEKGVVPSSWIADAGYEIYAHPSTLEWSLSIARGDERELITLVCGQLAEAPQPLSREVESRVGQQVLESGKILNLAELCVLYRLQKRDCGFDKSYLEHVIMGSTFLITPDPFRVTCSYFSGEPEDTQDRILEKYFSEKTAEIDIKLTRKRFKRGWITLPRAGLSRLDPVTHFYDDLADRENLKSSEWWAKYFYDAKVRINLNTRAARIDAQS